MYATTNGLIGSGRIGSIGKLAVLEEDENDKRDAILVGIGHSWSVSGGLYLVDSISSLKNILGLSISIFFCAI
jgi:hypothetical protein